jgi:rare lipoprotein A
VRVLNLDNGKAVTVRINDRGPFVRGRVIDLTRAAAQQLDFIGAGVTRVSLTVVGGRGSLAGSCSG